MMWAQITMFALSFLGVGVAIMEMGEAPKPRRSGGIDIFFILLIFALQICAGTYSHIFNWPK